MRFTKSLNEVHSLTLLKSLVLLLKNHLSLQETIKVLPEYVGRHFPKKVLNHFLTELNQGKNMMVLLAEYLPKQKQLIFSDQEIPSVLDYIQDLNTYFDEKKRLKEDMVKAIRYPLSLLIFTIVLTVFMTYYVLPKMNLAQIPSALSISFWGLVALQGSLIVAVVVWLSKKVNISAFDGFLWQMLIYTRQNFSLKHILKLLLENSVLKSYADVYQKISEGEPADYVIGDTFSLKESEKILLKKSLRSENKTVFLQALINLRAAKKSKQIKQVLFWVQPCLLLGILIQVILIFLMIYSPILTMMEGLMD